MNLMPATHCPSGQSLAEEGVWVLRSAHTPCFLDWLNLREIPQYCFS